MATKPRLKKSAATLPHPIRVVPLHRPELQRVAPQSRPAYLPRGPTAQCRRGLHRFWVPNGNKRRRARL